MIDVKSFLKDPEATVKRLNDRGEDFTYLKELVDLDNRRKEIISEVEILKQKRNETSKKIGEMKRNNQDVAAVMNESNKFGDTIKELDTHLNEINNQINDILLKTPNVPFETVPKGLTEDDNVVIHEKLNVTKFDFEPKPHWDIAKDLDIVDFERGAKISGSKFVVYKGFGARLERALMNFFLDQNTSKGYLEILPPQIVTRKSMTGTGQLPKFEDDAYKLSNGDQFLIPTAEVPVTNLYSDEVIDVSSTIKHTAYSACFRVEAGSAGRDTRGIIRLHQFQKVELVEFTKQEDSMERLERLTEQAEGLLELLELPYRRINLCAGDLGFSSAMTYDLEVWLPSYNAYKEISSCSNFLDFQARRANIKYKDDKGKTKYVHTLNGSGLAIGRAVAAIIENYQQKDGSIKVPKVLVPYMGGVEYIK